MAATIEQEVNKYHEKRKKLTLNFRAKMTSLLNVRKQRIKETDKTILELEKIKSCDQQEIAQIEQHLESI